MMISTILILMEIAVCEFSMVVQRAVFTTLVNNGKSRFIFGLGIAT